ELIEQRSLYRLRQCRNRSQCCSDRVVTSQGFPERLLRVDSIVFVHGQASASRKQIVNHLLGVGEALNEILPARGSNKILRAFDVPDCRAPEPCKLHGRHWSKRELL